MSISFDTTEIERTNVQVQKNYYEKIVMKKAYHTYDAGKPDLPVFYYKFYVPKDKEITEVNFIKTKKIDLTLHSDLFPAQHDKMLSDNWDDTLFDRPDQIVYGMDSLYPKYQATIVRSDMVDGDMEIATIAVYPIQYNPKQKKISITTNGSLNINTTSKNSNRSNIFKGHSNCIQTVGLIKSIVENPDDVDIDVKNNSTNVNKSIRLKSTMTTWSVPFYEYVIITSRALKPAFTQFLTWKKRKGYNAGIVCVEDILQDPAATGDPRSSLLTDSAGKIRQYLYAGYNNPTPKTKYALLGGDYTVVPIRYGAGRSDSSTWADGSGKIPSDLYFSDFNSNWLLSGDTITGEDYLQLDYGPEIFVGRLLCNSETDIKTWTTKDLQYEENPGSGDYSYLSKALFTEADSIGYLNNNGFDIDIYNLPSVFTTKNCWKELPSENSNQPYFPTGSDVISELNSNYGLYCCFNHGSPLSFATATAGLNSNVLPRYQVTFSDSYTSPNITSENGNGMDNLTNYNYPTIIYSAACTTMPFDDYYYWGTNRKIPTNSRTLGTSFTVGNEGGGPSYIGYTRDALRGRANELSVLFFDSITTYSQIGMALAKSKIGWNGHWNKLALNLLGCPETELWTATPTIFGSNLVSENGSSVIVSTNNVTGSKICVMSALDNGASYYDTISNVTSHTFTGVSKPYYATITKHNKIPYQKNPTTVLIEHTTMSTNCYLNCQTVSAGYNVNTSDSDSGNVVIQNGASVTFDATGTITLDKGFSVQLGATFLAK